MAARGLKRLLPENLLLGFMQAMKVIVTVEGGRRTSSVLHRVRHKLLLHAAAIKVHDAMLHFFGDFLALVLETTARNMAYLHVRFAQLEVEVAAGRSVRRLGLNATVIKDLIDDAFVGVAWLTKQTVGPSRPLLPLVLLTHALILERSVLKVIIDGSCAEAEFFRLGLHSQTLQLTVVEARHLAAGWLGAEAAAGLLFDDGADGAVGIDHRDRAS